MTQPEENDDIFKGLSVGQKKKLKQKMKKEAEDKAEQAELGTNTTEEVKKEEVKQEEVSPKEEDVDMSQLSTAQKKKLKQKQKKEQDAAKGGDNDSDGDSPDIGAKGKKGKKGKKGPGGKIGEQIRLQQQQMQADREAEEAEEDERLRLLKQKDEDAKAHLEKKKREKEAKEQAKKERIAELKKQGLYLNPKQEKERQIALARRKQMQEQMGIQEGDEDDKPQAPVKAVGRVRKTKEEKQKAKELKEETLPEEDDDEPIAEEEKKEEKKKVEVVKVTKTLIQEESDDEEFDEEDAFANLDSSNLASMLASTKQGIAESIPDSSDENEDDTPIKNEETKLHHIDKPSKVKGEVPVTKGFFDKAGDDTIQKKQERLARQREQKEKIRLLQQNKKSKKLRCPIICILGHVDTGKTKILDKLRKTNVQGGEAGGITQQIGATYFPPENLQDHVTRMATQEKIELELPGFLVIDTPGHESFTNLRSRGSSLCDLAVLVIDIMHGLEQQTLESIQLLKQKKTPFCIALNKIDRLNQWVPQIDSNTRDSLAAQQQRANDHFKVMLDRTILAMNEQGENVRLYWEEGEEYDPDYLSIVPTSAHSGEGMCDLMTQLIKMGQGPFRQVLVEKDIFECTVLEVKVIEGHGTTIDVVLVNGLIKVGDTIVISGMNGPITTTIRALLTPFPMKEMRVKGEYQHHQKIKGAMGIKISAQGMEQAIAGSALFRCSNSTEIEQAIALIDDDLCDILDKYVDKTAEGVCVQASTIGSLEALLEFLKTSKIPVSAINIGPVHKKDVLKAMKSITGGDNVHKEFATILAFDVRVMPDAIKFAEDNDIKIFDAKIIYHLFDHFTEYVKQCQDSRKSELGSKAVFPCLLEMVKGACFNQKAPIIIGVTVKEGVLKTGTPLVVPGRENQRIGKVESIESNNKPVKQARKGDIVTIKLMGDQHVQYGRHFDDTNQIVSNITRDSIDSLKTFFRDEMQDDDWKLLIKLKGKFGIN